MDSLIPNKNKNSQRIKQKWYAVFELMQVVINGKPPKNILQKRRPLESLNNHSLPYRLDNFFPIQSSLFKRAIGQYLEVLNKSDVNIISNSDNIKKFESEFRKYENGRWFSLKQWLFNWVAEKRQLDPNAVIIVYPEINFLDGEPLFYAASTTSPKIKVDLICFKDVEIIDEDNIKVRIGEIMVNGEEKDYYLRVDENQYYIEYPTIIKDKLQYVEVAWYQHKMQRVPFTNIGGSVLTEVLETENTNYYDETFDYFVSDYHGATAFACYMIGALSDKQVNIARHNFPTKYAIKRKCIAQDCHVESDGKYYTGIDTDKKLCTSCAGSGYKKDTDTFGTIEIDAGNTLDGTNVDLKSPVGYVVPPIDSLKFLQEDVDDNYTKTAQELCVSVKQNITNASSESKSYDVQNKVSLISYIVEDILRIAVDVYSYCEMLLEYKSTPTISVVKPSTWDIKSKEDIVTQLTEAKTKNAPYFVIVQLTEELLLKELSDNYVGNWIAEILIDNDSLITLSQTEYNATLASRGAEITPKMRTIHESGLNILKRISLDKVIESKEHLLAEFTLQIDKITPQLMSI